MGLLLRSCVALLAATTALAPSTASAIPSTAEAKATARYDMVLTNALFTGAAAGAATQNVVTEIGDVSHALSALPGLNCPPNNVSCIWQATATAQVAANDGVVVVNASVDTFTATIVVELAGAQLTITGSDLDTSASTAAGDGIGATASASAEIRLFTLDGGVPFFVGEGEVLNLPLGGGTHSLTWAGVIVAAGASQAAPVPAPGAALLLAAALVALPLRRRAAR